MVVSAERASRVYRVDMERRGYAVIPDRESPKHRYHGPYRRRQDDHDGADTFLHGYDLQDGRGGRRDGGDGLDGPGAGARDHHHLGRDDVRLACPPYQYHRYAGSRGFYRGGRALLTSGRRR